MDILCDVGCNFFEQGWGWPEARSFGQGSPIASGGTRREGGPDEAVAFIAETVADLVKLAKRHKLEILRHLLAMAQLEAEERLRLRSKRKLS